MKRILRPTTAFAQRRMRITLRLPLRFCRHTTLSVSRALWEENRSFIDASIRKWLGGKGYQAARYNVLRRITQSAKYIIAEIEDPSEWVARTALSVAGCD